VKLPRLLGLNIISACDVLFIVLYVTYFFINKQCTAVTKQGFVSLSRDESSHEILKIMKSQIFATTLKFLQRT